MLTVNTAASNRNLLTNDEIRAAIGQPSMLDVDATKLSARVSAAITAACKVVTGRKATGGVAIPTLMKEVLSEKIWLDCAAHDLLIIARAPIVTVTSITEDGTALTMDVRDGGTGLVTTPSPDFEVDGFMLRRLASGRPTKWRTSPIVLIYEAGFETVPDDMKEAASSLARTFVANTSREAGLRMVEIPDVVTKQYTDKDPESPAVPDDVMQMLSDGGYINYTVD